jgi:hypothetical protein
MIIKNLKINKYLTFGVIIIVCFVYTLNTQPAVFGCVSNFFQIDDNKNIMNDMSLRQYEEFSSLNKNFPNLVYKTDTLSNMILQTNIEIRYELLTYTINDNAGFVLQFSYFYNLLENNPECISRI